MGEGDRRWGSSLQSTFVLNVHVVENLYLKQMCVYSPVSLLLKIIKIDLIFLDYGPQTTYNRRIHLDQSLKYNTGF